MTVAVNLFFFTNLYFFETLIMFLEPRIKLITRMFDSQK